MSREATSFEATVRGEHLAGDDTKWISVEMDMPPANPEPQGSAVAVPAPYCSIHLPAKELPGVRVGDKIQVALYLKTILLFLLLFTGSAAAQATFDVSAGAILNNPSGTQDFYYALSGRYKYDRLAVGLDVFGDPSRQNPKTPTRGAAFATFEFLDAAGWNFTAGAGGFKWGNEVNGFGQIGMKYKNFEAWGRAGGQDFYEAEAFYPVFRGERLQIGPTFLFSRMENIQTVQRAGIRLSLR